MEPNFENGDYLIIDELSFRFRDPQRGEVVVFKYPQNPSQKYIKRIIGLPGETVEIQDGKVAILNQKEKVLDESNYLPVATFTSGDVQISLGDNEYFVLGDNSANSFDSRYWGFVPHKDLLGKALFIYWPPYRWGAVR